MLLVLTLLACMPAPENAPAADTGDAPALWGRLDHVVTDIRLARPGQGQDLDGDGKVDNAVGGVAALLGPVMGTLGVGSTVMVLQIQGAAPDAEQVGVALVPGWHSEDEDEPGVFHGGAWVDEDGAALVTGRVAWDGVSWAGQLPGQGLALGGLVLRTATPVLGEGTVSDDLHAALLGFAVSGEMAVATLSALGVPGAATRVMRHADLDLDGDGEEDAISLAVWVDAVPCLLVR